MDENSQNGKIKMDERTLGINIEIYLNSYNQTFSAFQDRRIGRRASAYCCRHTGYREFIRTFFFCQTLLLI
jgi:hypothetical protein